MTKKKSTTQTHKERPAMHKKKALVEKLTVALKESKTVAILDVRALPDRILQKARSQLRGRAQFFMAKNSVIKRALMASGEASKLADQIDFPTVVVASNELSPYGVYRHFATNKQKVAAKPGQTAEADIVVHEGETDLPPGPALSELKAAGIAAIIKGGKIAVQKDSTVAKAGDKIPDAVCKALQKLGILPFEAGVNMVAGYNGGMIYNASVLNVDPIVLTAQLTQGMHDAYNMSINCTYPTAANRDQLLAAALLQSKGLATTAGVYSSAYIDATLAAAIRAQVALEGKVGQTAAQAQQ